MAQGVSERVDPAFKELVKELKRKGLPVSGFSLTKALVNAHKSGDIDIAPVKIQRRNKKREWKMF